MTVERDETPTQFTPLFPADEIPRILDALLEACAGLNKKSDTEIENRLTCRLWQRVRRLEPFRDGPLHITNQVPVADSDIELDTPEGQIDLQVISFQGPHIYFAIEAKRLRVRSKSGRLHTGACEYVKNGMMRFINGQYAPRMNAGAMLGYVFDGNITAAGSDIAKAIKQRCEMLKLRKGTGLRLSKILPHRQITETMHAPDKRTFILYHLLVYV